MAQLGKINALKIVDITDDKITLDAEDFGFLVLNDIDALSRDYNVGETVSAFIYLDNSNNPVVTAQKPKAQVGDITTLKVIKQTAVGAFLDWGLKKDLLAPFGEQRPKMEEGNEYLVYIYLDKASNRIVASSRVRHHISNENADYRNGEEVDLHIIEKTDIGFNAIINNQHIGTLFSNEIFSPMFPGQKLKGFIKSTREDNKIDLSLQKPGYARISPLAEQIFSFLENEGGYMAITDKSSPELIKRIFKMSKKNFKQSIGQLYKSERITIDPDGIRVRK